MIKAPLDFHDPVDIYDYFKNQYGPLSMLISQNMACLTFENALAKKHILQNPKPIIKGYPLNLRAFEDQGPIKNPHHGANFLRQGLSTQMELQGLGTSAYNFLVLGQMAQHPIINRTLKEFQQYYDTRIKEIKQRFLDPQQCNTKITEFNSFVSKYINNHFATFQKPIKNLSTAMNRFSLNPQQEAINLDQASFAIANQAAFNSQRKTDFLAAPHFIKSINYCRPDVGSVKRLCLLNENNFITTMRVTDRTENKGQLRIYRKGKEDAEFSINIEQGPYSIMIHQNFILTGDQDGRIHFIDVENQNACEFSNRLSPGLIVQMQKYQNNSAVPSIITLFTGTRNDFKIKLFEIENQRISNDINSLSFHPREQILCEGITMTMEALQNGKFAYGCGKNTYICPSFDRNQRDYITHEHNVMKLRMKNSQELIEATERKIVLLDLRAYRLKNEIFDFKYDINNVQMLSQHYAFYGGKTGEVGVVDCRKPNVLVWNFPQTPHCGKISDILLMGKDVLSADGNGNIFEWKNQQIK